jgi:hypothetical protein
MLRRCGCRRWRWGGGRVAGIRRGEHALDVRENVRREQNEA